MNTINGKDAITLKKIGPQIIIVKKYHKKIMKVRYDWQCTNKLCYVAIYYNITIIIILCDTPPLNYYLRLIIIVHFQGNKYIGRVIK